MPTCDFDKYSFDSTYAVGAHAMWKIRDCPYSINYEIAQREQGLLKNLCH